LGSLGVFLYTNRKKGGGAGWQGDFVEELLVESWKGRKTIRSRGRRISHGMTRKKRKQRYGKEEAAKELATE